MLGDHHPDLGPTLHNLAVVLHRCGSDFYFLIVCTWRNENELWQTVWYKDGDRMDAFAPFEEAEGTLAPGDRLVLYTDGVTDDENMTGERFGVGALQAFFALGVGHGVSLLPAARRRR